MGFLLLISDDNPRSVSGIAQKVFAVAVPLLGNSSKGYTPQPLGQLGSRPWSSSLSTVRTWSGCAMAIQ